MSRLLWLAGLVSSVVFVSSSYANPINHESPIGYWKTMDETTGKPKSIVKIWQTNENILMGKVVKIFSGAKNQTTGTVILSELKATENQWGHGKIFDPENGKSYNCSLKVAEAGEKLKVNGYIGIPLLGHSQTWERVDLMSDA